MLACCTVIVTIPRATSAQWTGPLIVTTRFCVPGAYSPRLLMVILAPDCDCSFLRVSPALPRIEPINLSGTWRVKVAVADCWSCCCCCCCCCCKARS